MLWTIVYLFSVVYYSFQNQVISDSFCVVISGQPLDSVVISDKPLNSVVNSNQPLDSVVISDKPLDSVVSTKLFVNNEEFAHYKKREFTRWVEESKYFKYLQDEKEMMLPEFNNTLVKLENCKTTKDFISFFKQYQSVLFKNCTDFRVFSHCQEHYLFQFDTSSNTCHTYFHEPYLNDSYNDVTLTIPLSANRLDRLPFHFDRWNGNISIAIQLNDEELEEVANVLTSFQRQNVRYTFYVIKQSSHAKKCSFVSFKKKKVKYESCYVVNELRNLAIETIQTTHFIITDGDGLLSDTLQSNLQYYISQLKNPYEVLLLPVFPFHNPKYTDCIELGICTEAWSHLPRNKKELLKDYKYVGHIKPSHIFYNLVNWRFYSYKKRDLFDIKPPRTMEPYGILKRTNFLPLFHPYFINYGGNKEHYYNVLKTMGCHFYSVLLIDYEYHVLPLDFVLDLPHPPSKYRSYVRNGDTKMYAEEMFAYFNAVFNRYCRLNSCKYFQFQWSKVRLIGV